MYLRPGNLIKDFVVEPNDIHLDSRGRPFREYQIENETHIKAVLAEAKPDERERWQQLGHPISHTLTQRGKAKAKPGNRLIHGSRVFYIQGVDNVGELGIATIYYAEERSDLDGYAH